MTTKTDAAKCAEEIKSIIQQLNELKKDYHTQYYYEKEIESVVFRLNKLSGQHFPPSVPVSKLEAMEREYFALAQGTAAQQFKLRNSYLGISRKLQALIAEAK